MKKEFELDPRLFERMLHSRILGMRWILDALEREKDSVQMWDLLARLAASHVELRRLFEERFG